MAIRETDALSEMNASKKISSLPRKTQLDIPSLRRLRERVLAVDRLAHRQPQRIRQILVYCNHLDVITAHDLWALGALWDCSNWDILAGTPDLRDDFRGQPFTKTLCFGLF